MASSGKKWKRLLLTLAVIIAAAGGVSYFLLRDEMGQAGRDVEAVLAETDGYLAEGYYLQAEDVLKSIDPYRLSGTAWLSLLKRAHAVSEGTGNYAALLELCEQAVEELPGNEEIRAVYVFSLLRMGFYEKGFEIASQYLENSLYRSLIYEAALHMSPDKIDPDVFEEPGFAALSQDIDSIDPEAFESMTEKFADPRLYAASAVLWMIAGRPDRAVTVSRRLEPYREYDLLRLHIAYDSGDYETALGLLGRMAETGRIGSFESVMLESDILMHLGHFDEAAASYEALIGTQPEQSWIPYLNLSWLTRRSGTEGDPLSYLIEAYKHFPDKRQVILPYALFLLQQDRSVEALAQLEQLKEEIPEEEQPAFSLLIHYMSAARANPEQFKAVLWELYNANPSNERIAQFFVWYLLGFNDIADAEIVLKRFEQRYGAVEWTYFYRGIISALRGNMIGGRSNFESSLELSKRWETQYNLALISMNMGDISMALDRFRAAERLLSGGAGASVRQRELAAIRVKTAWILYLDREYESAQRELSYALEIDPENLEGQLLRKKLEADGER